MVHDDAQSGDSIGQQDVGLHQIHGGIRGIQRQVGLSQQLQIGDLIGIESDLAIVRAVETAGADRPIKRILVKARHILAEIRLRWIQVSRNADHNRIGPADFEIPEIVVDPGTRLDHDGADNAGRSGQGAIQRRQHGFGDCAIGRRTHILRAQGTSTVEEMNVRVDDGNVIDARRLGMRGVQGHNSGRGRGARQKRAAA